MPVEVDFIGWTDYLESKPTSVQPNTEKAIALPEPYWRGLKGSGLGYALAVFWLGLDSLFLCPTPGCALQAALIVELSALIG